MEENKSSLAIPAAIIFAGLIIAGAVYFSNKNRPVSPVAQNTITENAAIKSGDILVSPVSQKDYIRGNPSAKVVLIEFSDTECPFCKVFHGTMKNLVNNLAKDGTFAWVYRNFPLKNLHPKAHKEGEALLCAGKVGGSTGFWDYTDRLYSITPSNNGLDPAKLPAIAKDVGLNEVAFNMCLNGSEMAGAVTADYEDGVKAGGSGTPFSILLAASAFDKEVLEKFLLDSAAKYRIPTELFVISSDNKKLSMSGAMPQEFMTELIALLAK